MEGKFNIPYGKHFIDEDDIDAVINVLKSDYITQGSTVPEFEKKLSEYCKSDYAIAVSSGTAALHILCLALGIGKESTVWTSPISFVASANCALYAGAEIDFVDIDVDTGNISITALEQKLEHSQKHGKLPDALIVVHFSGRSCDMKSIANLATKYNFLVIEDAAHALGGTYNNKPIGNCEYSDAAIFSFHPVKSIATGEGGAIITNNHGVSEKLKTLRTHGITRDISKMQNPDGPWYYEQQFLGFNYRMTDIQAALGISQLKKLDSFISHRVRLSERYNALLKNLPLLLPIMDKNSAWHLYTIQINDDKISKSRKEIYLSLHDSGIKCNVHYIPIHLQKYYKELGFNKGDFPEAEKFYNRTITLPLFPTLKEKEQDYVMDVLEEILK